MLERYKPSEDERIMNTTVWQLVSKIDNGEEAPVHNKTCIFSDREMSFYDGNLSVRDFVSGLFMLDPTKTPKTITINGSIEASSVKGWFNPSGRLTGIYKFDGDRLSIAYRKGDKPPDKFESSPGSGVTLLVLKKGEPQTAINPNPVKAEERVTEANEKSSSQENAALNPAQAPNVSNGGGPAAKGIELNKTSGKIRFKFRYIPWKEVLSQFADKAGLSLMMDAPPPGTFNYSADKEYTVDEAIDLLNWVLLTKGYRLVRHERILMLVNFEKSAETLNGSSGGDRAIKPHEFVFKTAKITRGDIAETVSATGTIEPAETVDVSAQVSGRIVSFGDDPRGESDPQFKGKPIDYNSPVEEGTVLAFIDDALYKSRYEQEQAGYIRAKAELATGTD